MGTLLHRSRLLTIRTPSSMWSSMSDRLMPFSMKIDWSVGYAFYTCWSVMSKVMFTINFFLNSPVDRAPQNDNDNSALNLVFSVLAEICCIQISFFSSSTALESNEQIFPVKVIALHWIHRGQQMLFYNSNLLINDVSQATAKEKQYSIFGAFSVCCKMAVSVHSCLFEAGNKYDKI